MVSSSWVDPYWIDLLAPRRIEKARNLFYDQYACKIEFWFPDGHYFRWMVDRNPNTWWHRTYTRPRAEDLLGSPQSLEVYQCYQTLSEIRNSKKVDLKIRSEGNCLQIYTKTECELRLVSDLLLEVVDYTKYCQGLHLPDENDPPRIGVKRTRTRPQYRYSVRLRGTRAVREKRKEIERYIRNLGVEHALATKEAWGGSRTIFCNDIAQLDFLQLICPGCLGKIYELVPDQT